MIKGAEYIQQGAEAEEDGDISRAIRLYESGIRKGVADPFPFDRLMVHYRKQKKYKDELRVLLRGVDVFTRQMEEQQQQMLAHSKNVQALRRLSRVFGKTTGLTDKKGKSKHVPEPIARWLKRKRTIESRLKKNNQD